MATGYYTKLSESIGLLIPKQRGKGFLKAPFGGAHRGPKYGPFERALMPLRDIPKPRGCFMVGEPVDIDNQPYIPLWQTWTTSPDRGAEVVKIVVNALREVFPYVDEWEEMPSGEYWKLYT